MFSTLKTFTPNSLSGVCVVSEKNINVSVSNSDISCHVPISENGDSSVSISIDRQSGRNNVNFNNVDSIAATTTLVTAVTTKLKAILSEIETL